MYKKAAQQQLRFSTPIGPLSVEQLWTMPMTKLAESIREIKKVLKTEDDDELSFLTSGIKTVANEANQLRFDILKDVYVTRKQEAEDLRTAAEAKEKKAKIMAIIEEKKEGALKDKSIEELEKLL